MGVGRRSPCAPRTRPRAAAVALVALAGLAGCAASPRALKRDLTALGGRFDDLRRTHAAALAELEALQNRLLILQDQVETLRLAVRSDGRVPRLPVVKLAAEGVAGAAPAGAAVAASGATDPPPAAGPEYGSTEDPTPRPLLRLYGSRPSGAGEGSSGKGVAAEVGALPGAHDSLGVVPLADEPRGMDPLRLYRNAFALMGARRIREALLEFADFAKRFPRHPYADNAIYWMGECYYDQSEFALALVEFERVIKVYPKGNKVPDALLKLGYTYARLGDVEHAKEALTQVVELYPESPAAELARRKLVELR